MGFAGLGPASPKPGKTLKGVGLKGRYRPMRARSAARFCRAYDELRNFLRPRTRYNQHVPAHRRRSLFLSRTATVLAILEAA